MAGRKTLSPRQHEVLVAYLHEGTVPAAARSLDMNERTVKEHLDTVRQKLGVDTVHQLPRAAIDAGLIKLEVLP